MLVRQRAFGGGEWWVGRKWRRWRLFPAPRFFSVWDLVGVVVLAVAVFVGGTGVERQKRPPTLRGVEGKLSPLGLCIYCVCRSSFS